MSHYGIANVKTTAGNFAEKAAYFEKKAAELTALQEKKLALAVKGEIAADVMAEEIRRIDAEIARVVGSIEQGDQGTGREDYYHKSGNDTIGSSIEGPLKDYLRVGDKPLDGDYLALFRGINPRTGESFLNETRVKQIEKSIQDAEGHKHNKEPVNQQDDRASIAEANAEGNKRNEQILGFSSCVSLQKSISIYWAQASDEERKLIEQAFMDSVRDAINHEHEQGYVGGRIGAQGGEFVRGDSVALTYLHCTARRAQGEEWPDPQLHVHIERPNFVRLPDGTFQTLDAGKLYARQREFGAVVDVALYERLRERMPELAKSMVVDWAGHGLRLNDRCVSREEVEANSKRSKQIDSETQELAQDGAGARQAVAVRGRETKNVDLSEGVDQHWRESIGEIQLQPSTTEELQAPTLLEVQQMLFRGESVVEDVAIDRVAAQLSIGQGGLSRIPEIRDQVIKQLGLIEIPRALDEKGKPARGPARYTTEEMIRIESDCLKAVYAGLDNPRWKLEREKVDTVIDRYQDEKRAGQKPGEKPFTLTDEQRQAAYVLTGAGQFTFLKGAAGVGKSATLAPVFRAYQEAFAPQGTRIIGVAPQNKQATELQKSTGIQSQTVHSLLLKHQGALERLAEGKLVKETDLIQPGDIIVCDEAGTLDTFTMHALVQACHERQARLICAGDRNQHGAVATAALFGLMHDAVGDRIAVIETISRQILEYRPTAQALYQGKAKEALTLMEEKDQLRIFRSHVIEADQLVAEALADMKKGLPNREGVIAELGWPDVLILADTNEQVRALNEKVRDARFAAGELSDDPAQRVRVETEVLSGQRFELDIVIGDRLLLRKNAKDAESKPVYNGDLGTVLGFRSITREIDGEQHPDIELTVARDDGKTVRILAGEYRALQHGYAMTSTKSQGMTVAQAYYLPSEMTSLQAFYVSYTRGVHGAKTYVNETTWKGFAKSVDEYRYKSNALDLMPTHREAIRSTAINGQILPLKPQELSVADRLSGVSPLFQFPGREPEPPREPQKIVVIEPAENEIRMAKAYGRGIVDLREDGQQWPHDKAGVAVITAENPPIPAEQDTSIHRPGPITLPPLEDRPSIVETLQSIRPATSRPHLKLVKPEPMEGTRNDDDRRPAAAAAPGIEQRDHAGRDPARGPAAAAGRDDQQRAAGEPARPAAVFGKRHLRLVVDNDRDQRAEPGQHFQHRIGAEKLDPFAAGRSRAPHNLRLVRSGDLAAAGERGAEGVLPADVQVHGGSTGKLRRTADRAGNDAAVTPARGRKAMPTDKSTMEGETQRIAAQVDLAVFARSLGYRDAYVWEKNSKGNRIRETTTRKADVELSKNDREKGGAILEKGGFEIFIRFDSDAKSGKADRPMWWNRDSGEWGDAFALYQREHPGSRFRDAKAAVNRFARSPENLEAVQHLPSQADRQRKAEQRPEDLRRATDKARRDLGLMGRHDRYLEAERGITPEVLAEARWKSNRYGSAVFPHHNAHGEVCGYEYRGVQRTGDDEKQFKGFSKGTQKGVYVANPQCREPRAICFSEGGVDTLSVYQLTAPDDRQHIKFLGTAGEPGPNTQEAVAAVIEKYGTRRFLLAYDNDQGGDKLTGDRRAWLLERYPEAQIEDIREQLGMQRGEDPNQVVLRLREAEIQRRQADQKEAVQPTSAPSAGERPAPVPALPAEKPGAEPEQEQAKPSGPSWTPAPAPQQPEQQEHDYDHNNGMER